MNIFVLTLVILLSQDTVQVSDKTYHTSLIDCQKTAQVLARAYVTKLGALKVYAQCKYYQGV